MESTRSAPELSKQIWIGTHKATPIRGFLGQHPIIAILLKKPYESSCRGALSRHSGTDSGPLQHSSIPFANLPFEQEQSFVLRSEYTLLPGHKCPKGFSDIHQRHRQNIRALAVTADK